MFDLQNKVALVTGATSGIGLEIVQKYLECGAWVIATGRDGEKLQSLFDNNKQVFPLVCDLSRQEEVESMYDSALEKFGRIDILVSNAGITKDNLALRMTASDFADVMQVNAGACFLLNKLAVKSMMKARYGRIINISSVVAFTGNAGQVNYSASKAAIVAITKSLAREVASRNITVNSIAPGFIQTKMTDVLSDEIKDSILKNIPLGCMGLPRDVAYAAVYLASDEARYMTGQTLHINGGMFIA
jgi:3-oxoacyl-[acyl-carrier protein] reductase